MDNIFVYVVPLPDEIYEAVAPCADGYTVWLSDRLSNEQRMKEYRHAIRHIEQGDFERFDVQEIETQAHRKR